MSEHVSRARPFSKLSKLVPEDPATWAPLFLTLDIDWADDAILNDAIDFVERADVEATWFVTHDTPVLARLRENPKFELGIHPNFNDLLAGGSQNGKDLQEVLSRLMDLVPEAKALRSHSLCSSTRLLQLMPEFGLTHESNLYLPPEGGSHRPFRIWNGIARVPHFFEDDLFLFTDAARKGAFREHVRTLMRSDGLRVFDFHPIHAYLNTEDLTRYERTRAIHRSPDKLIAERFPGEGARTALEALLDPV
jgi:hypothetical protein